MKLFLDKHGPWLFGALLLLCSCFAHSTDYYVDCKNGSNGPTVAGTFDQPWRTPLKIGSYSASPGFTAGDGIYLHRDCVWHDGITFTSSGSIGNLVTIDSYGGSNSRPYSSGSFAPGTGAPPRLTGYLPIPAVSWSRSSGNLWISQPLYLSDCSSGACVQCNSNTLKFSCLDQPTKVLNYVRFGTAWGNQFSDSASLSNDRDWYFDVGQADIATVSLASNVVTVTMAPGFSFSAAQLSALPGTAVAFSGLTSATFLNGLTPNIGTAANVSVGGFTVARITAPVTHADYSSAADIGTAAYNGDANAQKLFVYCTCSSPNTNPQTYYSQVAAIAVGNEDVPANGGVPMLNLNGVTYVQVQHLLLDWYDSLGAVVQGVSDHIWLANMAANSYVENAKIISSSQYSQIGFWMEPSGTPTDIHLWNTDAHMNYAGYKFGIPAGSSGQQYDLKNCRAYANRTYGLVDDTNLGVTHDYCHFYGNNLATAVETDFGTDKSGYSVPTCATHDVGGSTCAAIGGQVAPFVENWKRWPAYVSLTYDDPGLVQYSDEYINQLLGIMTAKAVPLSIATVTGSDYSQSIISRVQGWINAGWDVITHSVSHEYWSPPAPGCGDDSGASNYLATSTTVPCHAFTGLQYTGSVASTVYLTISHSGSGGLLTISPSPFDSTAYHCWDLAPIPPGGTAMEPGSDPTGCAQIGTLGEILSVLSAGPFTVALDALAKGDAHAYSLADVSSLDIKTSAQSLDFSETNLETDEAGWASQWMNHYLTGLPSNRLYVMPSSFLDPATTAIIQGLGYKGIRGNASMKPCCGAANTLANGYPVLNILSQGVNPQLQNLSYVQMRQAIAADTFKNALWGRPIGYFWHINELPPDQVENMVDAFAQGGATLLSDTALMNLLLTPATAGCEPNDTVPPVGTGFTGSWVAGSFYTCPGFLNAQGTAQDADFRETLSSPTLNNGTSAPGASFEYDLRGNNRNSYGSGWDIGAFQFIPMSVGTQKHP